MESKSRSDKRSSQSFHSTQSPHSTHSSPTITAEFFQKVIDLYERSFGEITSQFKGVEDNSKKLQKEIEWMRSHLNEITTIKDNTSKTMQNIKEIKKEILLLKDQISSIQLKPETVPPKPSIPQNPNTLLEISPQNNISFKTLPKQRQQNANRRGSAGLRRVIDFTKEDELFNIKNISPDSYKSVVFDNWNNATVNASDTLSSSSLLPKTPTNVISYKSIEETNQNEPKTIQKLQFETHAHFLHSDRILCMIVLNDDRIATGGQDKAISICSVNIEKKEWNRDVYKKRAHNGGIYSLFELNESKIMSCSWDGYIKIWEVNQNDIALYKLIKGHNNVIYQIMKLSNKRIASCSYDQYIKVWNNEMPGYEEITKMMEEDGKVYAMLQLEDKEVLITSSSWPSIAFWNLVTYKKEAAIKEGVCAVHSSHMVEMSGNRIAVVSGVEVAIVDTVKYSVIKKVQVEGFVGSTGCLCWFDEFSFVWVCAGGVVQVSSLDYRIMYKENNVMGIDAVNGIKSVDDGKYLVMMNSSYGLTVMQPFYS